MSDPWSSRTAKQSFMNYLFYCFSYPSYISCILFILFIKILTFIQTVVLFISLCFCLECFSLSHPLSSFIPIHPLGAPRNRLLGAMLPGSSVCIPVCLAIMHEGQLAWMSNLWVTFYFPDDLTHGALTSLRIKCHRESEATLIYFLFLSI